MGGDDRFQPDGPGTPTRHLGQRATTFGLYPATGMGQSRDGLKILSTRPAASSSWRQAAPCLAFPAAIHPPYCSDKDQTDSTPRCLVANNLDPLQPAPIESGHRPILILADCIPRQRSSSPL